MFGHFCGGLVLSINSCRKCNTLFTAGRQPCISYALIRRFPKMGFAPQSSIDGWILHEINHPVLGVFPGMEPPPYVVTAARQSLQP